MEITQKQKNKLQYVEDCMKNALTEEQEYKIYMKEKEKAQANISKIRDRFKKENTEPKTWFYKKSKCDIYQRIIYLYMRG